MYCSAAKFKELFHLLLFHIEYKERPWLTFARKAHLKRHKKPSADESVESGWINWAARVLLSKLNKLNKLLRVGIFFCSPDILLRYGFSSTPYQPQVCVKRQSYPKNSSKNQIPICTKCPVLVFSEKSLSWVDLCWRREWFRHAPIWRLMVKMIRWGGWR